MKKPAVATILMDIEGTTSSVSFVHDILFPYSAERMASFVAAHAQVPHVRGCLDEAATLIRAEGGQAESDAAIVDALRSWIRADRKLAPLKTLQGYIWREGYTTGAYSSHLYEDVLPAWQRWRAAGCRLAIYSSGSLEAQKLLFAHTPHGDLTSYLAAYFDTSVGAKRATASYTAIADQLGEQPPAILFLSDVVEELVAAQTAGFATAHIVRNGTPSCGYQPTWHSFAEFEPTHSLQ